MALGETALPTRGALAPPCSSHSGLHAGGSEVGRGSVSTLLS